MTTQLAQNVLDYWYSVEFFNHYDLEEKIKDVRGDEQREFFISSDKLNRDEWSKHEGKTRHVYLLPFDVSQRRTDRRLRQRQYDRRLRGRAAFQHFGENFKLSQCYVHKCFIRHTRHVARALCCP